MSDVGNGYGSKYFLLRFLDPHYHRYLRSCLERSLHLYSDSGGLNCSKWLYNPKKDGKASQDCEYTGIDFFPDDIKKLLDDNWKKYWPQTGTPQNWDAILHFYEEAEPELADKWIIVEAKAHLDELNTSSGATNQNSIQMIDSAFEATRKRFNINTHNNWREHYYQFANRLAFVNFMLDNNIKCSFLNIYFINGWPNDPAKNVTDEASWRRKIEDEYSYLGITDEAKQYIQEVFIDCSVNVEPLQFHHEQWN
jgi:hypothetical protein